jgi:hypothetical protein
VNYFSVSLKTVYQHSIPHTFTASLLKILRKKRKEAQKEKRPPATGQNHVTLRNDSSTAQKMHSSATPPHPTPRNGLHRFKKKRKMISLLQGSNSKREYAHSKREGG